MTNDSLKSLAELIKKRNPIDAAISEIIGYPAHSRHIAEFVAAEIFDIKLHPSANHIGSDGYFTGGNSEGKSVNIKFRSKNDGGLDIARQSPPDFYLVLTGKRAPAESSRGTTQPWEIASVFLFNHAELVSALISRNGKIGDNPIGINIDLWDAAEIYPTPTNPNIPLSPSQTRALQLFNS